MKKFMCLVVTLSFCSISYADYQFADIKYKLVLSKGSSGEWQMGSKKITLSSGGGVYPSTTHTSEPVEIKCNASSQVSGGATALIIEKTKNYCRTSSPAFPTLSWAGYDGWIEGKYAWFITPPLPAPHLLPIKVGLSGTLSATRSPYNLPTSGDAIGFSEASFQVLSNGTIPSMTVKSAFTTNMEPWTVSTLMPTEVAAESQITLSPDGEPEANNLVKIAHSDVSMVSSAEQPLMYNGSCNAQATQYYAFGSVIAQ